MNDRRLAFHSKEKKSYRIPDYYHGYQFKITSNQGKDPNEILEELERRQSHFIHNCNNIPQDAKCREKLSVIEN